MPSSRTSTLSVPSSIAAVTLCPRRARVLDHVGQRLGHEEVRACLDFRRQARAGDVHLDQKVEARNEGVDAGPQTSAREDCREDPVGQLAKLSVALLRVIERLGDERPRPLAVLVERSLRELQRDDRMDQLAVITPHSAPSTVMGAPTVALTFERRAISAMVPLRSS
jgi:hypothetical protein